MQTLGLNRTKKEEKSAEQRPSLEEMLNQVEQNSEEDNTKQNNMSNLIMNATS